MSDIDEAQRIAGTHNVKLGSDITPILAAINRGRELGREEAAKALLGYARHLPECVVPDRGNPEECTCGLGNLIEAIDTRTFGDPL